MATLQMSPMFCGRQCRVQLFHVRHRVGPVDVASPGARVRPIVGKQPFNLLRFCRLHQTGDQFGSGRRLSVVDNSQSFVKKGRGKQFAFGKLIGS